MFGILLVVASSGLAETADSIGKVQVTRKQQSPYAMAFLSCLFGAIFLAATTVFGAPLVFRTSSLPTFLPRLCLEVLLAYVTAVAAVKADRTTYSFIRLITIPLLLVVDLRIGYQISAPQILGMLIILMTLSALLGLNKHSRRGAAFVLASALLAVMTLSLYKYDISHFNSIAAEQGLTMIVLLVFFGLMARIKHQENVVILLLRPSALIQSLSSGLVGVLESFAYGLAPASVIVSAKRGLGVLWSTLVGRRYFKETGIGLKLVMLVLAVAAMVLLAIR